MTQQQQALDLSFVEGMMYDAIRQATPEQQAELRALAGSQPLADFTRTLQSRFPQQASYITEERVKNVLAYDRQHQTQVPATKPASKPAPPKATKRWWFAGSEKTPRQAKLQAMDSQAKPPSAPQAPASPRLVQTEASVNQVVSMTLPVQRLVAAPTEGAWYTPATLFHSLVTWSWTKRLLYWIVKSAGTASELFFLLAAI